MHFMAMIRHLWGISLQCMNALDLYLLFHHMKETVTMVQNNVLVGMVSHDDYVQNVMWITTNGVIIVL